MSSTLRKIGKNIELGMSRCNISHVQLAEKLSLSENDIHRIVEGRLLIAPNELKMISELLNISVRELLNTDKGYEFSDNSVLFKNKENEHFILDIIDNYISLMETT